MRNRLERKGRIKLKSIYSLIGDQCRFIIVDQRHTLLFDSEEWESFAGWKLGRLKVTDIRINPGSICYTVFASKRFVRMYWRIVKRRRRNNQRQC